MKIVVATPDTLTARMAGPAIRAWQIACALAVDHDVQLVTTTLADLPDSPFPVRAVDDEGLAELERWCDVLVFQGWLIHNRPFLLESKKVLVADVYDPLHLEQLEQGRDDGRRGRVLAVQSATAVLNEQLLRGDYFLCASEKQRDFWLGQLSALGRVNPVTYDADETLRSLISVVPFGVPEAPPVRTRPAIKGVVEGIGPDDKVLLWGGGIYNWFDPLTLLHAVDRLRRHRPDVRLFFMGLQAPEPRHSRDAHGRGGTGAVRPSRPDGYPRLLQRGVGALRRPPATICSMPTSASAPTSTTSRPPFRSAHGCSTTCGRRCRSSPPAAMRWPT